MTQKPKLLILGHARHGKDTVAEILRDERDYSFKSSSLFLAERIIMPYFEEQGVPYASLEDCYADRTNHRALWFNLITEFNTPYKSRLTKEILEHHDMYVGMRNADEFADSKAMFDFVLWVDASGRGLPKEPRDSFNIDYQEKMILIPNNGTLEELTNTVLRMADYMEEQMEFCL